MFHIVESISVMDSRKRLVCNRCGKEHVMFSYAVRECLVCKEKFPNVFLMLESKPYRTNYYFLGAKENEYKDIL